MDEFKSIPRRSNGFRQTPSQLKSEHTTCQRRLYFLPFLPKRSRKYNHIFQEGVLPENLEELYLNRSYRQRLHHLPEDLKVLRVPLHYPEEYLTNLPSGLIVKRGRY